MPKSQTSPRQPVDKFSDGHVHVSTRRLPKHAIFAFVLCAVALASGGLVYAHSASSAIGSDQTVRREAQAGGAPQDGLPVSSARSVAVVCVFKAKGEGAKPHERIIPIARATGSLAKLCPGAVRYYIIEQDGVEQGGEGRPSPAADGNKPSARGEAGRSAAGIRFQSGGQR